MPRLFLLLLLSFLLSASAEDECVNAKEKRVDLYMTDDPPTLDTMDKVTSVAWFIQGHVFEGLMAMDKNQRLGPGVAERYEWLPGNLGLRFFLRKNAQWSDGKPVTAKDFVFAWQQVVAPAKANEYAFIMYYVKNGEKINKGGAPLTDLGVKAIDDYILEVQLENPCPFFLDLTTFVSFMPCREDFFWSRAKLAANGKSYAEMRYAATPADMLYNGPYKLTAWVKRTSLRMERNEHYWQPDLIKIHTLNIKYISQEFNANFTLFNSGKIAFTSLNDETLKAALAAKLPLNTYNDGGFAYLEFNHRPKRSDRPDWQPIFANRNFRLAFQHAIKSEDIVNRIIGIPGYKVGNSLVPHCIGDKNNPWPAQFPMAPIVKNAKLAREYLEKARLELKLEKFPAIDLLVTDDPRGIAQGEYLQYCLSRALGLKINLDLQTFKHRLKKQNDGHFDLVFTNWGPDYNDPMTYIDLLWSKNQNNHGAYSSVEYDALVTGAQNCADPVKRNQLFDLAQRHIRDNAVIVPIYERSIVYVVNKKLKGMTRDCLGTDPCLIHAWIEE